MRYSQIFGKNIKEVSKKYEAKSHELLIRGGFIDQVSSGIYSILPLGKRVLTKIEDIAREEMNNIGGQEISMPLIHPKALWDKTGRWETLDALFKTKSRFGQEYALAPTHEEIVTPLVRKFVKSYRQLPLYLYHITAKFRDEPRAKSGILRGREFGMKDLYSFHRDHQDLLSFYDKVKQAYLKIFKRCGLNDPKVTEASGGTFTKKYSHEFNVLTPAGEVSLIYCGNCDFAQNEEISKLKKDQPCPKCKKGVLQEDKAIEVGNIFDLGKKFAQDFDLTFTDEEGEEQPIIMGCYGIGTTRVMGAVVEIHHDEKGIVWPKELTPYQAHLTNLVKDNQGFASAVYRTLQGKGFTILYDDRDDVSAGEKFVTADLIGIPVRLVISEKTGRDIEWKERLSEKKRRFSLKEIEQKLENFYL